ncbi:hypothetical protein LINPERHAP2_LOCUS43908 [Linum perenne]
MASQPPVFEFGVDVVADSQIRCSTSLLARFFSPEQKPRQWYQATLGRKWNLHSSMLRVTAVGFGLFQIYFVKKADMDRVMRRRPHSIDGYLVNLVPWSNPSQALFDELRIATFWVRLGEVPVEFWTAQFGVGLLEPVGQVLHAGVYETQMDSREFVRGFVRIDVTRPFFGRRKARFSSGEDFWVEFGYEGLPTVCHGCGLLGHPLRLCPSPVEDGMVLEDRGPWMQAEQKQFTQVRSGGQKRSSAEANSDERQLTPAGPGKEAKRKPSSDLGYPLGPSSIAMAAGPSDPKAHLSLHDSSSSQGGNGPIGPLAISASNIAEQGVMGQALGSDLMDCSDGPNSDLHEVQPLFSSVLYDLSGLYITNPTGTFDNGLPIDLQTFLPQLRADQPLNPPPLSSPAGAEEEDYAEEELFIIFLLLPWLRTIRVQETFGDSDLTTEASG